MSHHEQHAGGMVMWDADGDVDRLMAKFCNACAWSCCSLQQRSLRSQKLLFNHLQTQEPGLYARQADPHRSKLNLASLAWSSGLSLQSSLAVRHCKCIPCDYIVVSAGIHQRQEHQPKVISPHPGSPRSAKPWLEGSGAAVGPLSTEGAAVP